jgi:hypothetical protein
MKKQIAAFLAAAVLTGAHQQARAAVIVSNLDPAEFGSTDFATALGQSVITGDITVSLTSVEFAQTSGATSGDSFAVYSRNTDGTLGAELFTGFSLTFDSVSDVTYATVTRSFTLQADTGYWFVLSNPTSTEWDHTSTPGYSSKNGATLPEADTTYTVKGSTASYSNLVGGTNPGPDLIQVNGQALPVPEPSAMVLVGLACAGGSVFWRRRRALAA